LAGLAADCPVPVQLTGDAGAGLPVGVESTAYFVGAEALGNAVRHSGASQIVVAVSRIAGDLRVSISDDGQGGAREGGGTGLTGMRQRVAAHDGSMTLSSPPGGPTTVTVWLPCES
jgi:signal transduction histidine kinase